MRRSRNGFWIIDLATPKQSKPGKPRLPPGTLGNTEKAPNGRISLNPLKPHCQNPSNLPACQPMVAVVDEFQELMNLGPLGTFLLMAWALWAGWTWRIIHADGAADDPAVKLRREWLLRDRFGEIYRGFLDRFLTRLENWIGDGEQLNREAPENSGSSLIYRLFGCNPWTSQSYDRLLLLALVYPFLSFLVGWIAGGSGQFAGLEVFPETTPAWHRFLVLPGFAGIAVAFYKSVRSKGYTLLLYLGVAIALTAVVVAGAGAGAFAVFFAVAFAFAFAVVVAGAFAGAGAGAGAGAFALAFAVAVAFVVARAGAGAVAVAVAVALAGAVAVAAPLLIARLKKSRRLFFYLLLTVGYAILAFLAILGFGRSDSEILLLLIFLVLMPLLNAPLDWISLEITRGLLQAIRTGRHSGWQAVVWILADGILALVFLLAMAATVTAGVAFSNVCAIWGGSEAIFALKPYLDALRDNPLSPDHWWVWIMLGTTLLPTLLHAFLGSAAFLTWRTERFRTRFTHKDWLKDSDSKRDLWFYVVFTRTFAVLGPLALVLGLWALLNIHGHLLGTLLYEAMVWVAGLETALAG